MAYSMNRPLQTWGRESGMPSVSTASAMHSGAYLLNTPKSLQPGSICPLCRVKVGMGHDYNAHLGSLQHAEGYLKEMSKHGPAYFYQMYDNLPFADPARSSKISWSPLKESNPFMVYAMRCGIFSGFKCKGCVKQLSSIDDYREHIQGKEHIQRTSFRISSIGENKYREIHFDVPSWPQEKLFEGRTSSVFPSLSSASEGAERNQESNPYGREKWAMGHDSNNGSGKVPSLLDSSWPGPQRDDGGRKRVLSPDRFQDKRSREEDGGYGLVRDNNSGEDKTSNVANQLQKMLQQLVQAPEPNRPDTFQRQSGGGSLGAGNVSSNQQALLDEMMGNIGATNRDQKLSSTEGWGPRQDHPSGNQTLDNFKSQLAGFLGPSRGQDQAPAKESQQSDGQQYEEKMLFINGLPREFDSKALAALCTPFGRVIDARIFVKNRADPYGFVEMSSRRECMKIIQALNGHTMPGCRKHLMVNFANKKRDGRKAGSGHDDKQKEDRVPSHEDEMLREAKRREEALRREVEKKEAELKKEAERLEIERKQAELQRKMDRIEAERKQVAREREQEKIRLEMEKRVREEEEKRQAQIRHEERSNRQGGEDNSKFMSETEVFETQLREAQIREEEMRNAHMSDERHAQMHANGMREAQVLDAGLREAHLREVAMRDREILEHELRSRGLNEMEIREMLIRQAENQERDMHERGMRENEIQEIQLRELRERQMREEASMHGMRHQNDGSKPIPLLDLPLQHPDHRPPMDGPPPEIREQVLDLLGQLERMGVHELEIIPKLLEVMGVLNPATLRVLGEMEPAMLEKFCVVDPQMLMQLATSVPGLQHLVEQVNLHALIALLRSIGPLAVQMLARTFAFSPELFVGMKAMVHNMLGGLPGAGDMGYQPQLGDGILPTPEPLGVAVANQLQMLQEQFHQNSAQVPWPPRSRSNQRRN